MEHSTKPVLRSIPALAVLALAVLALVAGHEVAADAAGPVVPLPAADQQQLEQLLGTGVVGAAQPASPLGSPEIYMPPKGSSIAYHVIEKGKAIDETHKVKETADASSSRVSNLVRAGHQRYRSRSTICPTSRRFRTPVRSPSVTHTSEPIV